jgi:hypothetical protein
LVANGYTVTYVTRIAGNIFTRPHENWRHIVNPIDLLQGPLGLVFYLLIILAILRIVAPNGFDFETILQLSTDPESPRGVQEEEPVRWQVERLSPRAEGSSGERPNRQLTPTRQAGI